MILFILMSACWGAYNYYWDHEVDYYTTTIYWHPTQLENPFK